MDELDAWLTAILIAREDGEDDEQWLARVKKQLKDKILQSFRNGQKAGPRTRPVKENQAYGR